MGKKTHQTHYTVPELPWHDKSHTFGVATDTGDADSIQQPRSPRADTLSTVALVETGKCYYCGQPALYAFRSKLYCGTCWVEGRIGEDN